MAGRRKVKRKSIVKCFSRGQQAAANEALQTLLIQRPDIAKLPRERLGIWWQPDMVEHLIVGLRKAGLEV
jgi:hypothetical protein